MKLIYCCVIAVLILSGCAAKDPFAESMRSGKDALIEKDYEEAVRQFEISLIEKPQDEDAKILLDQSQKSLEEQQSKQIIDEYNNAMGSIPNDYQDVLNYYTSLKTERTVISLIDLENLDKIKEYKSKADAVIAKYNGHTYLQEVHNYLITSMDKLDEEINEVDSFFSKYIYDAAKTNFDEYITAISKLEE